MAFLLHLVDIIEASLLHMDLLLQNTDYGYYLIRIFNRFKSHILKEKLILDRTKFSFNLIYGAALF